MQRLNVVRLNFLDRIANLYIIILIVGFLFIGTIPQLTGFVKEALSIQYRIVVLGFSTFFLLDSIFSKRVGTLHLRPFLLFFLFWMIYSVRVIVDLYIIQIDLFPETSTSQYMQFAFGVVLIPSIALLFVIQKYRVNVTLILKLVYGILLGTFLVALYYRASTGLTGRTAGDFNVGILLFGQYGATLSILSVYFLVKEKLGFKNSLFYVFGFAVGFSGIFVSASKSPFIALLVVSSLFLILWYGSIKSAFIITFFALVLGFFYLEIVGFLNQYFDSNFLDRLLYTIELGGDRVRESLMRVGFSEFVDSPFLGNAMLIQSGDFIGSYPHNIIIEAFMATGFLGGAFFLFWVIKCFSVSIKFIKAHSDLSWIALLFMQYLIFAMFSGNLYSNDLFWFFSVLLIGISRVSSVKRLSNGV